MRSVQPRLFLLLVAVLLLAGLQSGSSAQSQTASPSDVRLQALHVVRVLNTAEAWLSKGQFVSFDDIVKSGRLPEIAKGYRGANWTGVNLQSQEPIPGWQLKLVVAADGQSYKLSLVENAGPCRFGYFSDEVGIIYHGKAIDCPVD